MATKWTVVPDNGTVTNGYENDTLIYNFPSGETETTYTITCEKDGCVTNSTITVPKCESACVGNINVSWSENPSYCMCGANGGNVNFSWDSSTCNGVINWYVDNPSMTGSPQGGFSTMNSTSYSANFPSSYGTGSHTVSWKYMEQGNQKLTGSSNVNVTKVIQEDNVVYTPTLKNINNNYQIRISNLIFYFSSDNTDYAGAATEGHEVIMEPNSTWVGESKCWGELFHSGIGRTIHHIDSTSYSIRRSDTGALVPNMKIKITAGVSSIPTCRGWDVYFDATY